MATVTPVYSPNSASNVLHDIRDIFSACDVSPLIVQMRYFLELFGQTLSDIGTTEVEVEKMRREGHRREAMAAWHAACCSRGARARMNVELMENQLKAASLSCDAIGVTAKALERLKKAVARRRRTAGTNPRKKRAA